MGREAFINRKFRTDSLAIIDRALEIAAESHAVDVESSWPFFADMARAAIAALQSTPVVRETDRERISASVPCTEAIKADLGTAIREEENPGLDEYATAFNRGLRKARQVAFRLLDASLVGLDTRPAFMTAGGAIGIEHDGKLICQSAAGWHDWATRPHTPTPSPDNPND